MKTSRTEIFESMPVPKAVMLQALPAIISQMVTLIYNLADTYFVGLLNSPAQTASVSVAMPVFMFLTAISNLFGVGGAGAVAQALGRNDEDGAHRISAISIWGGALSTILFCTIIWSVLNPVIRLVGGTSETLPLTRKYLYWTVLIGGIPTALNILLANLVRAEGKSGIASVGVSLGGILNAVLDPFFVLPRFLGMGAAGAGLATAISNLAGMTFFLVYILRSKTSVLRIAPGYLKKLKQHLKEILKIGTPSALQFALTVVAVSAMTKFVSFYSTEAVAAFGIQKKMDQLPLYFSVGMANGLLPILAYNYASGNQKRRQTAFKFGVGISVAFSVFCLVLFELAAPSFAKIFIGDAETVRLTAAFLRIQVIAQPLVAINYPMIVQFQAMGQVKEAMICSILRKGVVDIPLLFLMNSLIPLYGCMLVQPIVDCIALVAAIVLYRKMNRRIV